MFKIADSQFPICAIEPTAYSDRARIVLPTQLDFCSPLAFRQGEILDWDAAGDASDALGFTQSNGTGTAISTPIPVLDATRAVEQRLASSRYFRCFRCWTRSQASCAAPLADVQGSPEPP